MVHVNGRHTSDTEPDEETEVTERIFCDEAPILLSYGTHFDSKVVDRVRLGCVVVDCLVRHV